MSEHTPPKPRPRASKLERSRNEAVVQPARKGVSSRAVWTVVLTAVLLGGVWVTVRACTRGDDAPDLREIEFSYFAEDSTATVGLAGEFPPEGDAPLQRPLGIDGDGTHLYVALGDAGTIGVFTYRGGQLAPVIVPPVEGVAAAYPVDVAVLSDGRIAVADTASMRVVLLDPTGSPDSEVGTLGGAEDAPGQPTSIAALDGAIFVADAEDKLIKEYTEDGSFVRAFGRRLEPRLTFAGGLHAEAGLVFVSDSNASRVLVLDLESGKLKTTLQERMGLPRGITTDDEGRIYIAEEFDAQVAVFDPTGFTLLDVVGDMRTEGLEAGGALAVPDDVYWDSAAQHLYVTDSAQGRVKVYNVRQLP